MQSSISTRSVALVTGASSGLGLSIAKALAERGYAIVACSRGIRADHPSIVEINTDEILAAPGDIGEREVARQIFESAVSRFGHVDLLVNNAGIFIPKPFTEYTVEDFEALLTTNVRGFFNMSQLAVAHMVGRGSGHIVNITTSLAENPLKAVNSAVPILTKGGINAATRALALELCEAGVRVNAVSPGIIRTPMHAPETHEFLATLSPMGRIGDAQDAARAVLYLEDASFVTGEILHVDGGSHTGRW